MSLPARIDHWLLRRHTKSGPWPIGSGAVTTKGATMPDPDPIETIAEVIWGTDYDYEQRYRARRVVSAIRTQPALRRSLWLALTTDNPLSRVSKAPSSPVGEPEGLARPIPPDAPNGLTSGPEGYVGVIRPDASIETACEVMHDAYENAAVTLGWTTNVASRKPWADVPEANKATMRVAVDAVLKWIDSGECAHTALSKIYREERDLAIQERDEARATIARMRTGRP